MKKWITGIAMACILFVPLMGWAAPEGTVMGIKGVLVLASDQQAGMDPSLKPFESQLSRVFRFSGYRAIGRGSSQLKISGAAKIDLGQGFSVQLRSQASPGAAVPMEIRWMRGEQVLIHTRQTFRPENPVVVLGGPSHQNGVLLLVLTTR